MRADLGWQALQWPAMEHVIARVTPDGFRADGRMVLAEDRLTSVRYTLECDPDWQVRRLSVIQDAASGHQALELTSDAAGHWAVDHSARPDLDGCTDIDISQTPLTNTLPIRRLPWREGQCRDLAVVYVRLPELTAERVVQRYTLLSRDAISGEAVFRYESGTFCADLPADPDGFVVDYPGLWRRLAESSRA
jgi:hypothetical protein